MAKTDTNVQERETFIEGILSKMSLEQKVGQCFTIHWGGSMITPYVVEAIEKLHIGGLRVTPFGQNSRRGKHYHQSLSYDFDFPTGYKKIKQNLFIPGPGVFVSPEQYAERLNKLQKIACTRTSGRAAAHFHRPGRRRQPRFQFCGDKFVSVGHGIDRHGRPENGLRGLQGRCPAA